MSVSPMQKVRAIGHASERDALVALLQDLGVLQFIDFREVHAEGDLADFAGREAPEARDLETRLGELEFLADFLGRFREKQGLAAGQRVEVTLRELDELAESFDPSPLAGECRELERRQSRLGAESAQLETLARSLAPWRGLRIPFAELRDTDRTRVWAGILPSRRGGELTARLEEARAASHVERLEGGAAGDPVVVIALREEADRVQEILRELEFADAAFPAREETADQELRAIEERRRAIDAERASIAGRCRRLAREFLPRVLAAADVGRERVDRAKAPAQFAETEAAFLAEGWIRWRDLERLARLVRERFRTVALETIDPDPGEEPPVELENPEVVRPFELVTDLYGRPRPREVDPTPFLAPFFAVFFALCLTDGGYGLVLAAVMAVLLKKKRLAPGPRRLVRLLLYSGLVTVAAGVVTGGYFGVNVAEQASDFFLVRLAKRLVVFDPINDPMIFFSLSLACGAIHVFVGFLLKWWAAWRSGDRLWGTLENLPWLVVSLALGAVMIHYVTPLPGAAASLAMGAIWPWGLLGIFLLAPGRTANPVKRLLGGLGAVYGVVGLFGDILSYSRLLALGLATAVIAGVIDQVAGLLAGIPFAGILLVAVLLVIGHVAYIAISSLGAFVHTSRLTFVEFFTKFYAGGGRPFTPFRKRRQYVLVAGEEEGAR